MCPKQVNPSHVSPLVLVVSMTRIFSLTVPTLGVCQLIKTAPPHMLAVCIFLDCVHRLWKGVGLHSELCLSYWNVTIVGFKNLLRTTGDSAVSFCITGRNKLHRRKLSCFFLPWQGSWNLSSPKSRQTRLLLPKDFLFLSSSPFPPRSPSFNYVHFIPSLVSLDNEKMKVFLVWMNVCDGNEFYLALQQAIHCIYIYYTFISG